MKRPLTTALLAVLLFAAVRAAEPKRGLLLTHNTFYNHSNLEAIEDVLPELGASGGFTVTSLHGFKQTINGGLRAANG